MALEQQAAGSTGGTRNVPDDFPRRVATKIVTTTERERDPDVALHKVADLLHRNLAADDRVQYFPDTIDELLLDDEAKRYAALSYVSLAYDSESNAKNRKFIFRVLDFLIESHINITKPEYVLEDNRRARFSYYARHLGEVFIKMIDLNSDLYEVISIIFSEIIRKEMAIEQAQKSEGHDSPGRRWSVQTEQGPKAVKKLFDEVVDYIHARGDFRSDSLNQQNPNEFMAILADRMRGTRRYVIQDIINRQALAKKKELEKELSERLANAEDIILARDSFKKALNLFWTEKLYNFKYLSVEKVRVTLQVMGIVLGILYFLVGYLGLYGMLWWEGLIISVCMYTFARLLCSRKSFRKFFPDDVSKELEVVVGTFTPTLRRMSKEQMEAFLLRQVRDPGNGNLLPILAEFVKYLFAVMPDRRSAIVTMEQLGEMMENVELDIARTVRAAHYQNIQ